MQQKTYEVERPSESARPFYTNWYTNVLRQSVLQRLGGLALHVGQHVRIGVPQILHAGVLPVMDPPIIVDGPLRRSQKDGHKAGAGVQ